jgi:hypothetical protein
VVSTNGNLLTWLLGTLVLSIPALWNGYPLVYSDTGTYIYSAADLFVPDDRPVGYGLWVRCTSLMSSLWLTVAWQNALTAWMLLQVVMVVGLKHPRKVYLLTTFLTAATTGVAWYTNQIMPDCWTPLLVLGVFLLVARNGLTPWQIGVVYLVVGWAAWVHFSHMLMLVVAAGAGWLLTLRGNATVHRHWTRLALWAGVCFSAYPVGNYLVDGTRGVSKGSHVFFMAHLAEAGIMQDFLDRNCHLPEYAHLKMCQHKDSLPQDIVHFLWLPGNIFTIVGGWEDSKPEMQPIIVGTLTQPAFLLRNVAVSLRYGFLQLGENTIGQGLSNYDAGSPPHQQVEWRFKHEEEAYLNARQQQAPGYTFDWINPWINAYTAVWAGLLVLLWPSCRRHRMLRALVCAVVAGVVLNSFITAGLSAPLDRYQARVAWLLPWVGMLVVAHRWQVWLEGEKE